MKARTIHFKDGSTKHILQADLKTLINNMLTKPKEFEAFTKSDGEIYMVICINEITYID